MIFNSRSRQFGTLIAVASLAASGFSTAAAETVATVNGVDIDSTVFDAYLESRFQKPAAQATADERGLERAITDYLAGMTDRYAGDEYRRLFDPHALT